MYYRVTHNGYDFKFCDTEEENDKSLKSYQTLKAYVFAYPIMPSLSSSLE